MAFASAAFLNAQRFVRLSWVCLLCLLTCSCTGSAETPEESPVKEAASDVTSILVLGDSISLGQGAGGDTVDCPLSGEYNRQDLAYGNVLGRELGASVSVLAVSGRGLVHNFGGMNAETLQTWLGAPDYWRLPHKSPDLILLNVGTNDFYHNDAGVEFELGYLDLTSHLLVSYPDARLITLIGPMLDDKDRSRASQRIQAALSKLPGDDRERVDFIQFKPSDFPSISFGCQWHPSAAMHQAMAATIMAHFLRE